MSTHPIHTAPVAVVLVNWNGWRDTIECIDSVLAQDYANMHIIVIDNASNDDSVARLEEWCRIPYADPNWAHHDAVARWTCCADSPPVPFRVVDEVHQAEFPAPPACRLTIIRSKHNLGFAAGCNIAVTSAHGQFDYFWFLNNDTVIVTGALSALVRRAAMHPRPGITGSTISYYDRPGVVQALGGAVMDPRTGTSRHIGAGTATSALPASSADVEKSMSYVMGASMLVSQHFIDAVGMMREDYFLYYEEVDWAIRGRARFTFGYAPDSRVIHKSQASGSKVVEFSTRFYYRNRIRFTARFYPQYLTSNKRSLCVELLRHVANRRWIHVRLIIETLLAARRIAADSLVSPGGPATKLLSGAKPRYP